MTEEVEESKAPAKIEDGVDGIVGSEEDGYEKDRARFEELKKAVLNSEDEDGDNEDSEEPQTTTGGIETNLP